MVLLGILGRGVPPGSPNPDPISDLKMEFSTPVFRLDLIHTRFQTWPLGRNYVIITKIIAQTKNSSNPLRIRIFLFVSYAFGIETINTFIHSRSSLKPYPIPDQNRQSVYPFSDQNSAKTLPGGAAHTYIAYIREYPPGEAS